MTVLLTTDSVRKLNPIPELQIKKEQPEKVKIEIVAEKTLANSTQQVSKGWLKPVYSSLSTQPFQIDEFLTESLPHNKADGISLFETASRDLEIGLEKLLARGPTQRTFANTVLAYHDLMIAFDAAERLVRSERLIDDDLSGKKELLNRFVAKKNEIFSDIAILNTFIGFAENTLNSPQETLSAFEMECLKGMINSIQEKNVPDVLLERLKPLKQNFENQEITPFLYLKGAVHSKKSEGSTKEFSCLNANLCMMPEANSMIYGGLLPWVTRIEGIVNAIKEKNPDILCLQEIYDVRAIFALREKLADTYSHFYGNIAPHLCGFNHESLYATSGLAVISKFKLANVSFEPYETMTQDVPVLFEVLRSLQFHRLNILGFDKLKYIAFDRLKVFGFDRNYGVFHFDVNSGKETLAHIATTHQNPFFAEVRDKQTQQIIALFSKLAANNSTYPLVLCGDLNTQQGDMNEAGEVLIKKHFIDNYVGDSTWNDLHDYWYKCARNVQEFLKDKPVGWTCDRSLLWSDLKKHVSEIIA